MGSAEDCVKHAEQCLADARQQTDRIMRIQLRQWAAVWVRKAEQIDATEKCAQQARAVGNETDDPMMRSSMNRLAEEYESQSG